jgi:polar amino acid transport system permease protein
MRYDWDFGSVLSYLPVFFHGLIITLALTGLAIVIGTSLGVVTGFLLLVPITAVRASVQFVTDAVRALPPLVLLLWVYYVVPIATGFSRIDAFWLAAIAFSLNLAAFVADLVRGSVTAFPRNLIDAAVACGIHPVTVIRRIVVPDLLREILPALIALYIGLLKLTSLASIITVQEVVHSADQVRLETFRVIEVYTVLGALYLAVLMPLSAAARRLEKTAWFTRR